MRQTKAGAASNPPGEGDQAQHGGAGAPLQVNPRRPRPAKRLGRAEAAEPTVQHFAPGPYLCRVEFILDDMLEEVTL